MHQEHSPTSEVMKARPEAIRHSTKLSSVLTILPIVTSALYLLGSTYHQGFLNRFGIEETLFPLSVDRIIFEGFVAFITLSAAPFSYALVAAIAIIATVPLAALISSNQRIRIWGRILSLKLRKRFSSQSELSESTSRWVDRAGTVAIYLIMAFALYLALLVIVISSAKSGQEQADIFKRNSTQSRDGFVALYFQGGSTPIMGKPIFCSTSYCAYWLGSETVIFKNDSIEKIVAITTTTTKQTANESHQATQK